MKTMKISSLLLFTVILIVVFTGCPNSSPIPTEYTITYDENGADSGTTPDDQVKIEGIDITLASNLGALSQTGFTFAGWNTASDGTGTNYAEGSLYSIDSDLYLYAKWTALPTYTITYNTNSADSGTAPADQTKVQGTDLTLAENSGGLALSGYTFTGWNTQADGNGTHYDAGGTYTADASETLYAEWTVTEATLAAALDPAQTGSTDYDFNYASGDSTSSISGDFTLPVLVSYGTDKIASVVWSEQSDPDNNVALSGTGNRNVTVIRSATDKTVTLRAAITAEGVTASKDIDFTILAATTGYITGIAVWDSGEDADSIADGELEGAAVTASVSSTMTPVAGNALTSAAGTYTMELAPANYYVAFDVTGLLGWEYFLTVLIDGANVSTNRIGDPSTTRHFYSATDFTVTSGATTTVDFFYEGY